MSDKHAAIKEIYSLRGELGRGAFSVVRVAVHRTTKERFAVKIIDKRHLDPKKEKSFRTEVEILRKIRHPNVIQLVDFMESPQYIYIIMELVTGGELFDRIVKLGSYTEADARELVRKMADALKYLHAQGVVHRDLKPENVLLKSLDDNTTIKIADFGLSKIMDAEKIMQTACGTPGYVAPEILLAEGYDKEVDLWALGVIAYVLLCGFPPFYSESVAEVFEMILNAQFDFPTEYWGNLSEHSRDFVQRLLVVDPKKRMTVDEVLAHPWLSCTMDSPAALDMRRLSNARVGRPTALAAQ